MEERFYGARLVFWSVLILAVCGAFALFGSRGREKAVSVSGEPAQKPVVILDPGHGGIDGGAVSRDGTLEKDLNLAVSKELGRLLYAQGFTVVYTRTDDTMPDAGRAGASRKMNDIAARLDVMKAVQTRFNANTYSTSVLPNHKKYSKLRPILSTMNSSFREANFSAFFLKRRYENGIA